MAYSKKITAERSILDWMRRAWQEIAQVLSKKKLS